MVVDGTAELKYSGREGTGRFPVREESLVTRRQTLAGEVSLEGVGLHTGVHVRLRMTPADAESGVVFVRTDAGGKVIPATLDHTGSSFYATVLESGGIAVSTVEHLMAALYSLQLDDVRIELDGPEVPALDGSAKPFVDEIRRAGLVQLAAERHYITIVRPVIVSEEEKRIAVYPCRDYRVTYAIDFEHPGLGYQELTASLWGSSAFVEKLAGARTFAFEKDVEALRRAGRARGGSLDNAVVIGEEGLLNDGLRFADEFVRHKMLDLTGDLALLGHPLRGHVVAYRAGHEMHLRLARRVRESKDCWHLAPWTDDIPAGEGAPIPESAPAGDR